MAAAGTNTEFMRDIQESGDGRTAGGALSTPSGSNPSRQASPSHRTRSRDGYRLLGRRPAGQSAIGGLAGALCIFADHRATLCVPSAAQRCRAGAERETDATDGLFFVAMTARTCAAKVGVSSSRRSGAKWLRPPV